MVSRAAGRHGVRARRNSPTARRRLSLVQAMSLSMILLSMILIERRMELMLSRRCSEVLEYTSLIQSVMSRGAGKGVLVNDSVVDHPVVNRPLWQSVVLQTGMTIEVSGRRGMNHASLPPQVLNAAKVLSSTQVL